MTTFNFPVELDNGQPHVHSIKSADLSKMIRNVCHDAGENVTFNKLLLDPIDPKAVWAFNPLTMTGVKFYFGYGFFNTPVVEPATWRHEPVSKFSKLTPTQLGYTNSPFETA